MEYSETDLWLEQMHREAREAAYSEFQDRSVQCEGFPRSLPETPISNRTALVLAAFDWDRASDLGYLDWFFGQWGYEPLVVPGTTGSGPTYQ